MKTGFLIAFMLVVFAAQAYGNAPNEWNPAEQQRRDQLIPWFQQIRQRIRGQTGFEQLVQALGEKEVYCSFRLSKEGDILDLKIVGANSSESLETAILSSVRKAAPIPKPPNELPYQKLIVLRFWKNTDNLYPYNPNILLVPLSGWSPNRYS